MPEKSPISLLESVFKGNSLTSSDENPTEVIKLVENYYLQSLVQFYRQNGHLLAQIDPLHHEIPRYFQSSPTTTSS